MFRDQFSQLFHIQPASRPQLYRQIYDSAEIASASYLFDLLFATGIATLGLVLNSPAVVIGAMLISPLMGPILASGLAFASSDIYLGLKSLVSIVGSVFAVVTFSASLVWLLPFQSPTAEILAMTQPNLLDLGVAVLSGLAGSLLNARAFNGGAKALPGAAIAVTLMPPLCSVGFGVGSGWNWAIVSGAALLFLTNLVAISGSAFVVFYLVGMDAPEAREATAHSQGSRLYALIHTSPILRVLGEVGQLRWRIAMVLVTLATLFVPLRSSLNQLRDETLSRAAAREAVKTLLPEDHVLSQQVEIFPDRVVERVVTTSPVDKQKVAAKEKELSRVTGKQATILVRQVANEDELIVLRERLRAPEPAAPPPGLKTFRDGVWPLVDRALKAVWPAQSAELVSAEVTMDPERVTVRAAYQAPREMDAAAKELLRNALRRSLDFEALEVELVWRGAKPAAK